MNAKAKGARSERKVKKKLEKMGYFVTKAGGSLGLWDLVAISKGGTALVIQVKTNRKPSGKEMEKLQRFANDYIGIHCIVAVVKDREQEDNWIWLYPKGLSFYRGQAYDPDPLPYQSLRTKAASILPKNWGRH
ncbi:MAG: hypothetical protein GTO63_15585 [Anaerolineae bacterium]|nr:hypothetical protein [Anaerolineae bacterium]NIN96251.1 hypothetical protein [Anaerolineae bacterium]NIQ79271.1 hypothetical protein [Anaerolineae bacterium]